MPEEQIPGLLNSDCEHRTPAQKPDIVPALQVDVVSDTRADTHRVATSPVNLQLNTVFAMRHLQPERINASDPSGVIAIENHRILPETIPMLNSPRW